MDEETGYANWDCHDALNMEDFIKALKYIRTNNGQLPPTLNSIQDKNEIGKSSVPDEVVRILRKEVIEQSLVKAQNTDIILCLVDGFLLYSDPGVVSELDIRLLVRAPYEKLKARREARSGYVTLEGTPSFQRETNIKDFGKIHHNTLTKLSGSHMSRITAIYLRTEM